jgi:phospholipase/lecithinase/hemolysin
MKLASIGGGRGCMATLQSLVDGFEAATNATVPSDALGLSPSPDFVGQDAITVRAGGFGTVYAFGDSLSDAGNVSVGTLGALPVSPPYSDGRFSNGNVWVQDLAQNLGLPPVAPSLTGGTDFAYGGAETGATAVHAENPTDLPSQLGQFAAAAPSPSPNALYTVWAGSNDVLDIANSTLTPTQQQASVQQAVSNETSFISGLVAHGAKDIVVLDVPDLGKTPYETARPLSQGAASSLAQQYDSSLSASVQQLVASGVVSIDFIDTYLLLDAVIANPAAYGLTNATQPVWTGNLTDSNSGALNATGSAQDGYLFFDGLHPTAAGHALLAADVTQTLTHSA